MKPEWRRPGRYVNTERRGDPAMISYAILFPGQGSQKVGMGADLFDVHPDLLREAAKDVLDWSLEAVVAEGPQDELTRTEHAQPALYAVSFALWRSLQEALPVAPAAAAGHSLGEYTALAAAGAISYNEGLGLVAERGRAMAAAAADGEPSSMAALIGADLEQAEQLTARRREEGGHLWVANINTPSQIVVAGSVTDIDWLAENARSLGIRRAVPLDVAGAFHSPYMASAASRLRRALADAPFEPPRFPVYANATALPIDDPARRLDDQLTSPVRFAEMLQHMADDGVTTFVHVGPGDVTAGLVRRTLRDATVHVVSGLNDVAAVANELSIQ
ncbi:MAG: ACP S-malonyltransferase [Actinomycetota bacterium]